MIKTRQLCKFGLVVMAQNSKGSYIVNLFISSIFNLLSFRNAWWRRVETPRDLVHHLSVPDGQGVGDEDLYQLRT